MREDNHPYARVSAPRMARGYRSPNARTIQERYLPAIFVLLLAYSVLTIQQAMPAGWYAERSPVHVVLALLVGSIGMLAIATPFRSLAKPIEISLAILTLWIVCVSVLSGAERSITLTHGGLSLWWLFTYRFFRRSAQWTPESKVLTTRVMVWLFVLFSLATVVTAQQIRVESHLEFAAINLAYFVTMLAPWMLLSNSHRLRMLLIAIWIATVAFSLKRGLLIVSGAMLISYGLAAINMGAARRWAIPAAILTPLAGWGVLSAVDRQTSGGLAMRFEHETLTEASGRPTLYNLLLEEVDGRPVSRLLFGGGAGSTIESVGTAAHNEVLEFLVNYGVGGVLLYGALVLAIAKQALHWQKVESSAAPAYLAGLVGFVSIGLFGTVYFAHSTFFLFALFGLIDGTGAKMRGKDTGLRIANG